VNTLARPPRGRLFLVPTPLDFGCAEQSPIQDSLPEATLRTAASLQHWITENAKSTRAFLKRVGEVHALSAPIQAQQITELPREVHKKGDHQGGFDARPLLAAAVHGHDVGLVSEAGMPTVADPGSLGGARCARSGHRSGTLGADITDCP